jgi:RHS repeat-associated protein
MGLVYNTMQNGTLAPFRAARFNYDSSGNIVSLTWRDAQSSVYVWAEYYYLRNEQGDIIGLLDNEGTRIATYTYDTWGNPLTTTLSESKYGYLSNVSPFRYRGYVYDMETNLYYCQSRYYDPSIGRFISADALMSTGQGVLGYNMYAYCLNNPASMSDPSGYYGTQTDWEAYTETCKKTLIKFGHMLLV